MTTLSITLHIVAVFLLAWAALRFKWRAEPDRISKLVAAASGARVTASWPFGTWTVRAVSFVAAVYLGVSLVQGVANHEQPDPGRLDNVNDRSPADT